jgi:hypothetical protein
MHGSGREHTAQEFNRLVIEEVMKDKKRQPFEFDDQAILDQLPQCPLHPVKMSNQRCRKCKKINEQYEELKAKHLHGDSYQHVKPKQVFNLDQIAQEWLDSESSAGFPLYGDYSKGNLNDLLRSNILRCQYFKVDLYEKKTYHEVLNEIDIHVAYVEPWTIGTHGVPSTLF